MNKKVIIGIVAVALIAGVVMLTRSAYKQTPSTSTSNTANQTTNSPSSDQSATNTITYSDSGFSPASLSVKAGSTVTIKNTSSGSLQFDSDPHPQHTDDTELNVGLISPGQSKTITVNQTGSHGYHNHLNSSDRGTLVIN